MGRKSEGQPFFTEELARIAIEDTLAQHPDEAKLWAVLLNLQENGDFVASEIISQYVGPIQDGLDEDQTDERVVKLAEKAGGTEVHAADLRGRLIVQLREYLASRE